MSAIQNLLNSQISLPIQCRKKEDQDTKDHSADPHFTIRIFDRIIPALYIRTQLCEINRISTNNQCQQDIKEQPAHRPVVCHQMEQGLAVQSLGNNRRCRSEEHTSELQ